MKRFFGIHGRPSDHIVQLDGNFMLEAGNNHINMWCIRRILCRTALEITLVLLSKRARADIPVKGEGSAGLTPFGRSD